MEARSSDTTKKRSADVADRRCGRCQNAFPGDPDLNFQTDWALCPACAAVLMPRPASARPAS